MEEESVFHVLPDKDGGWITHNGNPEVRSVHSTKARAIAEATRQAESGGAGQVVIHDQDGAIEESVRVQAQRQHHRHEPVPSRVTLKGHPVHPMLVLLPIAPLLLLPVADIGFAVSQDPFWARGAFYLLAFGFVTGVFAALVGLVDLVGIKRVRAHKQGWYHVAANGGALGLAFVNLLLRFNDQAGVIVPSGVILSLVTAMLIVVGGWYGGELAYRHKIGVSRE